MDRYAVIGNPVAHSLSPRIHAAFAQQTGESLTYERLLAPLDGFAACVDEFRRAGARGANVTVPFKLEAFQLADRHTPWALAAGAANTLLFAADGVLAANTDGLGLVRDLTVNLGLRLAGLRVLLLGAGGAARGVLPALLEAGPGEILLANRSVGRAEELLALAREWSAGSSSDFSSHLALSVCANDQLAVYDGAGFDVVINATSASLEGASLVLPPTCFAAGALAYDMMYGKGETPFLLAARQAGAGRLADGLGMLVEQAAESFWLWRGQRPDTAPVLAALREG